MLRRDRTLKKCFFVFLNSCKSHFTYKGFNFVRLLLTVCNYVFRLSLWYALLQNGNKNGVTMNDMVAYSLISTVIRGITYVNVAEILEEQIRDGSITCNLLLPVSMKGAIVAKALGENVNSLVFVHLPIIVIFSAFYSIPIPENTVYTGLFLLSLLFGMIILTEIHYLAGLLAFVIQRTWYIGRYIEAGLELLGGTIVPLWFFPSVLYRLSIYFPFRYIVFEPINFYLGRTPTTEAAGILLCAAAWIVILLIIEKLLWRKISMRISINGG